ncbi:MAG: class E sortase [Acidimicrobiales bacterium]
MTITPVAPADASAGPGTEPDASALRRARILSGFGRLLMTTGVVLALFAAYQLWGTGIKEARAQSALRDELDLRFEEARAQLQAFDPDLLADPAGDVATDDGASPADPGRGTTDPATRSGLTAEEVAAAAREAITPGGLDPELLSLFFPDDGEALARIELPSLDVDKVVVRGVQVDDLRTGPGHYPTTALPGNEGNAAIAGHRTTYGAPFNRIDELEPGDEVVITTVQGRFTYRVLDPTEAYAGRLDEVSSSSRGHVIVDPADTWVLGDFGDDRLTLTACNPKYSARERIIVAAELVSEPVALPPELAAASAAAGRAEIAVNLADESFDDGPDVASTDRGDLAETADTVPVIGRGGEPNLDEGLAGERDAIATAVGWMLAAILLWVGVGLAAHRRMPAGWRRLAVRMVSLAPVSVCLWISFEAIDRALPAY